MHWAMAGIFQQQRPIEWKLINRGIGLFNLQLLFSSQLRLNYDYWPYKVVMESVLQFHGHLANVNCLVNVFCLRPVNAAFVKYHRIASQSIEEMYLAMWNRHAPIPISSQKKMRQKDVENVKQESRCYFLISLGSFFKQVEKNESSTYRVKGGIYSAFSLFNRESLW